MFSKIFSGVIIPKASKRYVNMNLMNDKANGSDEIVITMLFKINKTVVTNRGGLDTVVLINLQNN